MKLVSVNVGLPREVDWQGEKVLTSIWKAPLQGSVMVRTLNLEGDRQSDSSVHGGIDKAVYVYPSEHYSYWRKELPGVELPWGAFGENLTTLGLLEETVQIGDRLRIGSAELVVTQPRMPCFKLAIRFGRPDIIKTFLKSGRTGFYVSVLREGRVTAGDSIECLHDDEQGVTVSDVVSLYGEESKNQALLRRVSELPALPEAWRDYFRKRIAEPNAQ